MTYRPPEPPEGRFGKWAYQLWEYVAKNRSGAGKAFVAGTGIIIGTATASGLGPNGTFTLAEGTSGVAAGTYGAAGVLAQLQVDALGRVTSGTNAGTLGPLGTSSSIVAAGAVTGTTTTGTLTTAFGTSWWLNQSYQAAGGTLAVGTGSHLVLYGNFAVRGSTGGLYIKGTGAIVPLSAAVYIR